MNLVTVALTLSHGPLNISPLFVYKCHGSLVNLAEHVKLYTSYNHVSVYVHSKVD